MSTSPLPPDPYEALGVNKECDLDEIKKAHRKLVLKHHPDRIKDPALVEAGKVEFQKVQQAYELLIDPVRRDRYNDQVRLAQLRRERMMDQTRESARDSPARNVYSRSSYPTQPPAQTYNSPNPRAETRSQQPRPTATPMYEERAPNDSYFDIPKYDDPLPKAHTRKAESYDRRTSAARPAEKPSPKPKTSGWDRPASSSKSAGSTINMVFGLKKAGDAAKKKVQEKEVHARAAKARDVEQHRERDTKQNYSRYAAQVADDYSSESSESSTDEDEPRMKGRTNIGRDRSPATRDIGRDRSPARNPRPRSPVRKSTRDRSPPITRSVGRERSPSAPLRSSARDAREEPTPKSQSHLTPEYAKKRATSPRPAKTAYFDVGHESPDEQHDPWLERHRSSLEYINASRKTAAARPSVSRQNSDLDQYWTASNLKDHKRSGSDSDRQRERPQPVHKSSSSHRRSNPQEYPEPHRPGLSTHTSAPAANMRNMVYESAPTSSPRPRQNSYDPRDPKAHRREMGEAMPPLNRTGSAPIPRSDSKRDTTAPIKPSTLKQTETNHDSGYGSGSAPHTPETGGESPPTEREAPREAPRERPGPKRESSKIYKVSRDAQDSHRAHKVQSAQPIIEEPFPPLRQHLSPEDYSSRPVENPRERRSSRTREEDRSRSTRERRPSMTRNETTHEERSSRSKHSHRSPERASSRTVPVDPNSVKYTTQRSAPARFASYHEPAPSSRHHSHHRHSESKPLQRNLFGQIVG